MEDWQQAFADAAAELGLEVTLYGEGLPGSFICAELGDITLVDLSRRAVRDSSSDTPEGPYEDMVLMVRPRASDYEVRVLQTPIGSFIHPHISVPYFCFGGNGDNIVRWANNEDWLVLINNIKNIVTRYSARGAYGGIGELRNGCRCLARFYGKEDNTRGEMWDCHDCRRECQLCHRPTGGMQTFLLRAPRGAEYNICEECASAGVIIVCPDCGNLGAELHTCSITGKEFCSGCTWRSRDDPEEYYHRDAFAPIMGDSYSSAPITSGAMCITCQRLVPHEGSLYNDEARCDRAKCGTYMIPLIQELKEALEDEDSRGQARANRYTDEELVEAAEAQATRWEESFDPEESSAEEGGDSEGSNSGDTRQESDG